MGVIRVIVGIVIAHIARSVASKRRSKVKKSVPLDNSKEWDVRTIVVYSQDAVAKSGWASGG